jgi:hypothetical protein
METWPLEIADVMRWLVELAVNAKDLRQALIINGHINAIAREFAARGGPEAVQRFLAKRRS